MNSALEKIWFGASILAVLATLAIVGLIPLKPLSSYTAQQERKDKATCFDARGRLKLCEDVWGKGNTP